MQHLEEGTIHAWLDGAVDPDEAVRIERHVAECAECAASVAEARGLIAGAARIVSALDVVRGNVIPRQPATTKKSLWRSLRLSPGRAALAASLLIAVATMLSVRRNSGNTAGDRATEAASPAIALDERRENKISAAPPPASQPTVAAKNAPRIASPKAAPSIAAAAAPAVDTSARQVASADTVRRGAPSAARAMAQRASREPGQAGAMNAPVPQAPAAKALADAADKKVAAAANSAVAAPTATMAAVDSIRARRTDIPSAAAAGGAGRGGRGGGGAPAGFTSTRILQEVVTTGLTAAPGDVVGCYEIKSDSAEARTAGRPFPTRFALQQAAGAAPAEQNVVRAVTADGRIDSVMTGSRWERLSPAVTNIYWTQAGGATQALTLRFAGSAITAEATTPAGARTVDVIRANCRP